MGRPEVQSRLLSLFVDGIGLTPRAMLTLAVSRAAEFHSGTKQNVNITETLQPLRAHLARTIVGQNALLERVLVALLSDGHVLIEGLPGLAKTTTVRCLAEGLDVGFRRVQFTPDLIPGDITGTDIYLAQEGRFQFVPGPLFHEIILADEINRAPPKVQSALLEAMQEHQVTVGGMTRALPEVFMVIATQNPIEHEGTYPLPEAQLDRFLLKIQVSYPSADEELEILRRDHRGRTDPARNHSSPLDPAAPSQGNDNRLEPGAAAFSPNASASPNGATPPGPGTRLSRAALLTARRAVDTVYMDDMLQRYVVTLVGATRNPSPWAEDLKPYLARGASPRASLGLARTARALALLRGRDFVEPGDVMDMADAVLQHRIGLSFAARAEGVDTSSVIRRLLSNVPVP